MITYTAIELFSFVWVLTTGVPVNILYQSPVEICAAGFLDVKVNHDITFVLIFGQNKKIQFF